jgi:glyoxylase-like metal-dependent hydrolase (beta-lactamase superfamily II)
MTGEEFCAARGDGRRCGGCDRAHRALATDPAIAGRLVATGRFTGPPELILVSHGHYDHLSDVPSLLTRSTVDTGDDPDDRHRHRSQPDDRDGDAGSPHGTFHRES